MMDKCSDPDENVLMCYVEVGTINFVERGTVNGDAMVVERKILTSWRHSSTISVE